MIFLYVHYLDPRSRNDIDLQYSHIFMYSIRCLLLLTFRSLAAIVSENPLFLLFPIEKPKLPHLTFRKIGQGQRRITIYINFVEIDFPMLQAKFQDHRTFGSGEEDFQRFLPCMGLAAILVM